MARQLVLASIAAAIVLGAAAGVQAQDMKRCDQLVAYYERYGGSRVSEGKTPSGRVEREVGYQECRKGNFAGGVRLLEEAIRKNGYNPPPG